MKRKKCLITVAVLFILVVIVSGITAALYYTSPRYKLEKYLLQKEYNTIEFKHVNDTGNISKPDEVGIFYTINNEEGLIEEVLLLKKDIELYLKNNKKHFENTKFNVCINDSSPLSIYISNQNENYKSDRYYELNYGLFCCPNSSIAAFNNSVQFDFLRLNRFIDYSDVSVFDSMTSLEYLNLDNNKSVINANIDYLIEKHPDCTIICNGKMINVPTANKETN